MLPAADTRSRSAPISARRRPHEHRHHRHAGCGVWFGPRPHTPRAWLVDRTTCRRAGAVAARAAAGDVCRVWFVAALAHPAVGTPRAVARQVGAGPHRCGDPACDPGAVLAHRRQHRPRPVGGIAGCVPGAQADGIAHRAQRHSGDAAVLFPVALTNAVRPAGLDGRFLAGNGGAAAAQLAAAVASAGAHAGVGSACAGAIGGDGSAMRGRAVPAVPAPGSSAVEPAALR